MVIVNFNHLRNDGARGLALGQSDGHADEGHGED